jgi:predicted secreted protein
MKSRYLTILICISTMFVANCKGKEPGSVTKLDKEPGSVTKLDNGSTISIPVDKALNIKLEANFSTGYSWDTVTIDTTIIKFKESSYESDKSLPGATGMGGMQQITFTPVSVGMTVLKLGYLRPWEGRGSMIDSFQINVKVHK